MLRLYFCVFFPLFLASRLAASCVTPALLSATAVTDSSASLTWTDVGDAYEVELRLASATFTGVPTHAVPNDPPFTVNGLISGSTYRFRVRTLCSGGGESAWSGFRNFSTALSNERPCPLDFTLRDTSCASGGQVFNWYVNDAPGNALGTDVTLKGLRLVIEHPWRSDLRIYLNSPDGTRIQVVGALNAGDQNLGNPTGNSGCGQYLELTDAPTAPPLTAAAEQDNITGFWLSLNPLSGFHTGQQANGKWTLEICDSKLNHTGKLRLAQLVFEPAGCAAPDGLSVSNISIDGASLSWNTGSVMGDSIQLEYGYKGFLPGTGVGSTTLLAATVAQPYAMTGLDPLQEYEVVLRQRCAPGLWSTYSVPASFFTVCPVTLTENFDTLSICPTGCTDVCPLPGLWQNAPGDDYEWKVRTGAGITYPIAGPAAPPGGTGNYLFFRNSCTPSGANGKKAILRTRCVAVSAPAGPPCHFSFNYYMNTKLGQMGSLLLEGSIDGGLSWQPIQSWSGNQGKLWRRAFVDLSAYDGQVALFQFTATGVFGAYGDIAMDNLNFYGSSQAGSPDYIFYKDMDNDGFGDDNNKVISCSPTVPMGYVTVAGDCDDGNEFIFPGAAEIKCNGIDENCNGMADDTHIDAPVADAPVPVCAGNSSILSVQNPMPAGNYYWFDAALGGNVLGTGAVFETAVLYGSTTIWVADSIAPGGCSSARVAVDITVLQRPDLVLGGGAEICQGTSLDLNSLSLNDLEMTSGNIVFYSSFPLEAGNSILGAVVAPVSDSTFYALKTASNGCSDTIALPVLVFQHPLVTILNGDSLALCKGKAVTLTTQATAGVSYNWSNGLHFPQITVAANGAGNSTAYYTVTVSTAQGCTASDALALTTLAGVSQTTVNAIQHVATCGGTEGSITLQPLNGLAPYSFAWTGPNMSSGVVVGVGAGGGTISNLSQGGYRVTVTDATGAGCSMVLPSLVINAPGLTVGSPEITQPVCPQGTGSISIMASGVAPVYLWSNAATTASVSGLVPGNYTVTVTDGSCQQIIDNINITAPEMIQIQQNALMQINCNGAQDGSIDIAVSGGTGAYSFQWSDAVTTEDRIGLMPGIYQVTVTDASNCTTVSGVFPVTQPPALVLSLQQENLTCFGDNSGTLNVLTSGGTPSYFTEWSTGDFTTGLSDLAAGEYAVTVTDKKGCIATASATIAQPALLQLTTVSLDNPGCVGKPDGSITVGTTGGTSPFSFLWSEGQTTSSVANLDTGDYTVAVTDDNGCTAVSQVYSLVAPQLINLTVDSIAAVDCYGGNDGYLSLEISGGDGNYTLLSNGVPAGLVQENLTGGIYEILVSDGNGCIAALQAIVDVPASPLTVSATNITGVSCFGDPTGAVAVTTNGGTPGYQYLWSNGASTEDLDGVLAGTYSMQVSDANGCMAGVGSVIVPEAAPIMVDALVTDIPCFGAPFGQIALSVNGGITPYAFQWSNGATTQQIYDLAAGDYAVSIFDSIGCVTVYSTLSIVAKSTEFQVNLLENKPVSCNAEHDGSIVVLAENGTAPYQFAWSAPIGLHANITVNTDMASGLAGGEYSVTVTDAAGCIGIAGVYLVEESPAVYAEIDSLHQIICKGDSTGYVGISLSGGVPPFNWLWSNGSASTTLTNVPAGTYQLVVTDFRGCTHSVPGLTINEPETALGIAAVQVTQDVCGTGDGSIDITPQGGQPAYQYSWSNGATTSDLQGLDWGNYALVLSDALGCGVLVNWDLIQPLPPLSLVSYLVEDVACFGGNNGSIAVGIAGGNQPLLYNWSNSATTAAIAGLPAGQYELTITDDAGCQAVFNLPEVMGPASELNVSKNVFLLPDGYTIVLGCTGGTPGYFAQWDNNAGGQTELVISGLAEGNYAVTVTDAGGCSEVLQVYAGPSAAVTPADQEPGLLVFPNPFSSELHLSNATSGALGEVWIRTLSGRLIYHQEGKDAGGIIPTADWPSGMYLLDVADGNGSWLRRKVVKM